MLGKSGKIATALKVFEEMKSKGIEPSTITYNSLIDYYGKHKDMANALKIAGIKNTNKQRLI